MKSSFSPTYVNLGKYEAPPLRNRLRAEVIDQYDQCAIMNGEVKIGHWKRYDVHGVGGKSVWLVLPRKRGCRWPRTRNWTLIQRDMTVEMELEGGGKGQV